MVFEALGMPGFPFCRTLELDRVAKRRALLCATVLGRREVCQHTKSLVTHVTINISDVLVGLNWRI